MSSQSSEEGKHKLLEHNRVSATVRAESSWTEEKERAAGQRRKRAAGQRRKREQLDRGERESSWTEKEADAA